MSGIIVLLGFLGFIGFLFLLARFFDEQSISYYPFCKEPKKRGFFEYSKQTYGINCLTRNGELVRSIPEKRIADYFAKNNIKYTCEKENIFSFSFRELNIFHPDFYLPDYDLYIEFCRLVDAYDYWTKENFVRNVKRKMTIYYDNIKFISIYPRNLDNLDWIFRKNH